jgi:hypothetical protein
VRGIERIGKRPLEQNGKHRVNKNDEENFLTGSIVMAGLVPAIHVFSSSPKTWMPGTSRA